MRLIFTLFLCTIAFVPFFAQYSTEITVTKDGSGDFTTIQSAVNATKSYPDKRITIHVRPGIYVEKVELYAWNSNLTIEGEDMEGTIITWGDHFKKIDKGRNSTFLTATLRIRGAAVTLRNLTIENSAGPVGQAIALYNEADMSVVENCRILGHQDALFADGFNARQLYRNTYIEGTTDFIFGGATAVFDSCTIHSKANSYITAASTPEHLKYGFVFINCTLTADNDVDSVFLGRPWRAYAKTAFIHCDIGSHIRPKGWDNWSDPKRELTTTYVEAANTGPGAVTTHRPDWIEVPKNIDLKEWSVENILNSVKVPNFNID